MKNIEYITETYKNNMIVCVDKVLQRVLQVISPNGSLEKHLNVLHVPLKGSSMIHNGFFNLCPRITLSEFS